MKNIVLCSDGTGNQDIKNRGTNVFKLYEAVDIQGHKTDRALTRQVAFYDDGVGTANAFAKVVGSAFGWGFSKNVKKLYRELVNVYEPGDKIFLFGFSRGAYTVRALASFIEYCGILDMKHYAPLRREAVNRKIDSSWDEYRKIGFRRQSAEERRGKIPSEAEAAAAREASIRRRRENHAVDPEAKVDIAFIGVWDTVGAIGAPFDGLRELISYIHPIWFTDNTLGAEVGRACHALSIDEERRTFHPELWNERNGADTRIKQVWFSGVHSNVGGGYPKQGMSLVTLDWMMNEAGQAGLRFIPACREMVLAQQDVHDKLYDSRCGINLYYRWAPRDITQLCHEHKVPAPKVHISVFERIANATFGMNGKDAYSPGNIPFKVEVDTAGGATGWPEAAVATRLPALMKSNYNGNKDSLQSEMRWQILSGKASYYAFLAGTLMTLAVGGVAARVASERRGERCGKGGRQKRQKGRGELGCAVGGAIVGLAAVGIKRWADSVDNALCKNYTEYWHNCRSKLRDMLYPPAGGTP